VIGEQAVDPYRMHYFYVSYAAGTLRAIACRGGKEVAATQVEPTGAAGRVALEPDRA